jgi:hypothetical protein
VGSDQSLKVNSGIFQVGARGEAAAEHLQVLGVVHSGLSGWDQGSRQGRGDDLVSDALSFRKASLVLLDQDRRHFSRALQGLRCDCVQNTRTSRAASEFNPIRHLPMLRRDQTAAQHGNTPGLVEPAGGEYTFQCVQPNARVQCEIAGALLLLPDEIRQQEQKVRDFFDMYDPQPRLLGH